MIGSESDLQPGDLVFFANKGSTSIVHVGIYAGGGDMWDAADYKYLVRKHPVRWTENSLQFVRGARYWHNEGGDSGGGSAFSEGHFVRIVQRPNGETDVAAVTTTGKLLFFYNQQGKPGWAQDTISTGPLEDYNHHENGTYDCRWEAISNFNGYINF